MLYYLQLKQMCDTLPDFLLDFGKAQQGLGISLFHQKENPLRLFLQ